jgi:DUF4097 and DUF4098 domain-containing protein YvlB
MNRRTSLALITLLFLPVLVYASSEGHFDRTLQVNGSVTLDVSTGSGDITVKTGSSNQVVVHGTVHSSNWIFGSDDAVKKTESNPPIQQSGNGIRIGYNLPDDVKRHVSINYEITVPADTNLQAHSGSGNIDVNGVRSAVEVQTGSGDIRARDLGKGLRAQTGSGNIRAESVAAPFNGQTGSGDIEADLTGSGDVDIHTGSGTIRVHGIKGGLRAKTGSGNIEADGSVTGPWQLQSGSGNVRLAVGSGNGFNLDAHTSSGSLHSDLPITVQGSLNKNQIKGAVNGGGPGVEVNTSSGDIDIR